MKLAMSLSGRSERWRPLKRVSAPANNSLERAGMQRENLIRQHEGVAAGSEGAFPRPLTCACAQVQAARSR